MHNYWWHDYIMFVNMFSPFLKLPLLIEEILTQYFHKKFQGPEGPQILVLQNTPTIKIFEFFVSLELCDKLILYFQTFSNEMSVRGGGPSLFYFLHFWHSLLLSLLSKLLVSIVYSYSLKEYKCFHNIKTLLNYLIF